MKTTDDVLLRNEVLMQLFVEGPTWDGNLISKSDRSDLFKAGLCDARDGWNFLTASGVETAVRLSKETRNYHDRRWYNKGTRLT